MSASKHNIHYTIQSGLPERQAMVGKLASGARRGRPPVSVVDRFWTKVNKASGHRVPHMATDCWLWTGTLSRDGYGEINASRNADGRQIHLRSHRVAWELTFGPIPEGLVVCHGCDVPACVNPDHLFVGTQIDNVDDAIAKGRLTGRPRASEHAQQTTTAQPYPHTAESAARRTA